MEIERERERERDPSGPQNNYHNNGNVPSSCEAAFAVVITIINIMYEIHKENIATSILHDA